MKQAFINNCHSERSEESQKKRAFTLAEVLITLTIIGIIAALTIPNLMQKWSDHADVQKVKEAYSILSNALKLVITENGPIDEWSWPDKNNVNYDKNNMYCSALFQKYLKFAQTCFNTRNGNCAMYDIKLVSGETHKYGPNINNYYYDSVILQNSMIFSCSKYGNQNNQIIIRIDINGPKEPNRMGYDNFYFLMNENGLNWQTSTSCTKEYNATAGSGNGRSCSAWIMKHGNMDYKYRDVSAEW